MKRFFLILLVVLCSSLAAVFHACTTGLNAINIQDTGALKDFFSYTPDRIPFVSAHRGGPSAGYPENCIATFENTLKHTHAILEVDPRYTKDSVIVLMHDATLDRTTTGTGRVSDYTWEELQQLRLKDPEGNVTEHRIPTFGEALEWAKGKTILVVDQKDVPMEARAAAVREHGAEANAILIIYSFEEAARCYRLNPDIVMEVMIPDRKEAAAFDKTGVPWKNVVAFITHTQPEDTGVYQTVHEKGAMCIVGSSRTVDKDYMSGKITAAEQENRYRNIIHAGADIIEADLAVSAGQVLSSTPSSESSKSKYFN